MCTEKFYHFRLESGCFYFVWLVRFTFLAGKRSLKMVTKLMFNLWKIQKKNNFWINTEIVMNVITQREREGEKRSRTLVLWYLGEKGNVFLLPRGETGE